MKWLSAGLTFVNAATVCGLVSGMAARGLGKTSATFSILVGLIVAALAYWKTAPVASLLPEPPPLPPPGSVSKRARARQRRLETEEIPPGQRYRHALLWLLVACFALFALRSFCWLYYIDNNEYKIQSPNNLGDLSIHLTYINNFASGVPLWPDNPIYVFSKLRYPAGIDLFNALLTAMHVDVGRGLIWTGLLASAATCYALYRWAGSFGIAAFLFNGGLAGYQFVRTLSFKDYQGDNTIAWKSIPLAMFVTQRGLLYAVPVGLLLLYQWRARFLPTTAATEPADTAVPAKAPPLPFWVEWSLYASMPLFHVHTFMALSVVLVYLFLLGNATVRKQSLILVGAALVPATFFIWVLSDNFRAGSVLKWQPGWVQQQGEFAMNFFQFWLVNLGAWVPLILFFIGITVLSAWKIYRSPDFRMPAGAAYLIPGVALLLLGGLFKIAWQWHGAGGKVWLYLVIVLSPIVLAITLWRAWKGFSRASESSIPASIPFVAAAVATFLLAYLVKTAPWEWDNIKIIIWAYFIILPFLWNDLIRHWPLALRAAICLTLFASGFISLIGGLAIGKEGFALAERGEVDAVGVVVRTLPKDARYLGSPTFNHPILLQGRRMVLGYAGHLWTQGFNYQPVNEKLDSILKGEPNWKENARYLQARYLFWGREERKDHPDSKRPWERESKLIASGSWGAVYDLESPPGEQTPPLVRH